MQSDWFYYDSGRAPKAGPTRTVTYNLDKAGNRISVVDTGVTTGYTVNELNQYYGTIAGAAIYMDVDHQIGWYKGWSYWHLNDEHLWHVQDANGITNYDLYYDALGRCVKRTLNGVTTYYVYDGEKPVLEYNTGGGIVGRNVYGKAIDEILMRTDPAVNGGAAFYYQHDHEGSVTHLTGTGGTVIEKYRYDVFGVPTVYDGSGNVRPGGSIYKNRFLFTGREYAATFGFYEYRARAYHPGLGRFMSEDPKLFDAGDYNLFRYCHNDPLDMTDPMGLIGNVWWRNLTPETLADMERVAAARELAGLSSTFLRASLSAQEGLLQQAREQARQISQGTENRSATQNLMPLKGQPYGRGLAAVNQHQIAYGKAGAEQMGRLSEGSMEANVAVMYNMDTGKYGYSGYVRSRPTVGGQEALTPALPPGRWVYAGQAHFHHNNRDFSSRDFYWSNVRGLPMFLKTNGVSMYVPPAAPQQSMSALGQVFRPGEF